MGGDLRCQDFADELNMLNSAVFYLYFIGFVTGLNWRHFTFYFAISSFLFPSSYQRVQTPNSKLQTPNSTRYTLHATPPKQINSIVSTVCISLSLESLEQHSIANVKRYFLYTSNSNHQSNFETSSSPLAALHCHITG